LITNFIFYVFAQREVWFSESKAERVSRIMFGVSLLNTIVFSFIVIWTREPM
jgi:hypothetical protein